ncbi:MAG: hypothetical protein KBT48_08685 [Firmicutes bacterium]|nr:hypothetical protein [Bacillota bacterium]
MKTLKRIISLIVLSCMMLGMAACAQSDNFDAKGYTEALMVLITTGDKDKLVSLGMSEGEADTAYKNLVESMEDEVSEQLENYDVTDKTREKWNEMLTKMFNVSKYSIDEAKKTDNGYTVDVHITPILFTEMSEDKTFIDAVQDKIVKAFDAKEITMDSIYDFTFYQTAEMLIKELDNPKFGEEIVVTVTYEKNSEGKYQVKDESETGIKIGTALFK